MNRNAGLHILGILIIVVALVVAACGGDDDEATKSPRATTAPGQTPGQTVGQTPGRTVQATATAAATTPTAAAGRRGGVFVYPLLQDVTSRDPAKMEFFPYYAFGANVYNRLTRYNWQEPLDKILPDLAQNWEVSQDGKTYTFRLRSGVQWHDGKPLTSEDGKFSLEKNATRYAPNLKIIQAMETPDPQTLILRLSRAQGSLPSLLATMRIPIFQKALHEELTAKNALEQGPNIGTGPFKLKDFQPNVAVEVERNANYFLPGLPYLDGIRAVVVKDAGTRLALFRGKRLHALGPSSTSLTDEQAKDVKSTNTDVKVLPFNALNQIAIVVNSNVKPFDDVRVRKALFLAIDRWAAADTLRFTSKPAGPNVAQPGWGLSDDELFKLPGYRKGADLRADQAEARRLLTEAGFPNGIDVNVFGSPTDENVQALEWLVGYFGSSNLGFRLKGGSVPSSEDVARRTSGDFTLSVQSVGLILPDPDGATLSVLPGLFSKLDDARMKELFDQQSVEKDEAKRRQLVIDLQRRVLEVVNIVPIAWNRQLWVAHAEVQNFLPPLSFVDALFDNVWLTR